MTDFPLISVVLPVRYVREDWLRQSIESVLNQDYPNKELIVVNDEATQDIDGLIQEYRIHKYIKNDRNRKLPYSLNRGFVQAEGELHTWTSADNYMLPGMLSRLAAILTAKPEASIVFGISRLIDMNDKPQGDDIQAYDRSYRLMCIPLNTEATPPRFTYLSSLGACFLYRKAVYQDVGGYDESLHGAEDYDFWIRASFQYAITRLPRTDPPRYVYRVHDRTMSAEVEGCYTRLRLRVLRHHIFRHPANPWLWWALLQYARGYARDSLHRIRSFHK